MIHRMTSFERPAATPPGETQAVQEDVERIGRARQGDQAAWEALVRLHQEPVFRFAYLLLGSAADAEDTAQETFIRAYRALDRFDAQRLLRPWLLSIAANLAHNRRRSLGRYLAALQRLGRAEIAAPASIEEKASRRMQAQSLWKAIRRLDEADQQVIYLRYFLEMSTEEAAQALEVAPGTVKSRLHRALGRLKAVIESSFPELNESAFSEASLSGTAFQEGQESDGR